MCVCRCNLQFLSERNKLFEVTLTQTHVRMCVCVNVFMYTSTNIAVRQPTLPSTASHYHSLNMQMKWSRVDFTELFFFVVAVVVIAFKVIVVIAFIALLVVLAGLHVCLPAFVSPSNIVWYFGILKFLLLWISGFLIS